MGPKGIGPQKLGAGQMSSQKSDCCGMPNCGCSGSPAKIAGVIASALVGKAVDKIASPNKKKNCKY
jgi:hypothetical protein